MTFMPNEAQNPSPSSQNAPASSQTNTQNTAASDFTQNKIVVSPDVVMESSSEQKPKQENKPAKEPFFDWVLLGFTFTIALVILFLFAGAIDVNIAYSVKYFFQYIILGLTVAMLFAGLIEWGVYQKKKVGFFSVGMVVCILLMMGVVLAAGFIPALLPVSNAILANDGPFTSETALVTLDNTSAFYNSVKNPETGAGALDAIYEESTNAGNNDVAFFKSLLGEASFGPLSGERLFAIMTLNEISGNTLVLSIPKFGSIGIDLTKEQLNANIKASNAYSLINSVKDSVFIVDESKLGESNAKLKGKYPDSFWINSRSQAANYLILYFNYKRKTLQAAIDGDNYIAAFIIAQQMTTVKEMYGTSA